MKEKKTHKNEMGKSRRECTGVQNQEEKHGQWKKLKRCEQILFFGLFLFKKRDEKSSWELPPTSLAGTRNSVLCKISVELDNCLQKMKLYSKCF